MREAALRVIQALGDLHAMWQPHDAQRVILHALFAKMHPIVFAELGRKAGKALALDTPIPTPGGWKAMGEIEAGDEVFDEHGAICRVLQAHDVLFEERCYLVRFSDGSEMVTSADHLWLTKTKSIRKAQQRAKHPPSAAIVTTETIAKTLTWGREWNHSIDNCEPLDCPEKDLPIDPYVLGVWLGDGSHDGARLTNPEDFIVREIEMAGYQVTSNGMNRYIKSPFVQQLDSLDLRRNKHIPAEYLRASKAQRLALIQGLMDTDGTICPKGKCEYSSSRETLALGMQELLHSFGMKCSIKSRIPKCQTGFGERAYRVTFVPHIPVFRLPRKRARQKPKVKPLNRFVTEVKPVATVPVRCLTVDSPSRLYLAGRSMIPTHNTECMAYFLWRMALGTRGGHYYFAPEQKQAKEIIWASGRLQNFGPQKYIKAINHSEMRITFSNGSFIKVDGSDNFNAYRGIEPHSAVYDEYRDFRPEFHKAFGPNLGVFKAPLFVATTPPEALELDHYDAMIASLVLGESYFNYPSWVNPILDKDWLRAEKAKLYARGEGDVWEREYGARRVIGGSNAIFPMWNRDTMVVPHDKLMREIWDDRHKLIWQIGADPGTSTCFAVLFRAINPYTKKVYTLGEIYEQSQLETSTSRIIPRLRQLRDSLFPDWRPLKMEWQTVCDEAAAWFIAEALASFDEYFQSTQKASKPKDAGLSLIKDQMLAGLYVVSDRCPMHIKEIEGYLREKDGKIPKVNDHTVDVARYLNSACVIDLQPESEPAKKEKGRYARPEDDLREDRLGEDEVDIDYYD